MSKATLYANDTAATPTAGKTIIYAKSDGKVYSKSSDGVERALTSPGTFAANAILANYRNRLINGNFSINQRGVSITTGNNWTNGQYTFDRWWLITESGNVNITQTFDPDASLTFGAKLLQPDLTSKRMGLCQIVESANIRHLKGKAFTLSGKLRCSQAQSIKFAVLYHTGTQDSYAHGIVNSWTNTNYSANNFFTTAAVTGGQVVSQVTPVANTWTSFSLTGTFPATMKNAVVVIWTEGAIAQNNTLELSNIQLEPDSTVSPYEDRFWQMELDLAQRYYWSSFPVGTQPAYNITAEALTVYNQATYCPGGWWNSYAHGFAWTYPKQMRVSPTATFWNSQNGTASHFYSNAYAAVNWASIAVNKNEITACYNNSSGSGGNTSVANFHLTLDCDI